MRRESGGVERCRRGVCRVVKWGGVCGGGGSGGVEKLKREGDV